jgi:hypothetical protein
VPYVRASVEGAWDGRFQQQPNIFTRCKEGLGIGRKKYVGDYRWLPVARI